MILCGREVLQDGRCFPLTGDSVLLAAFAAPKAGGRVLDLGAGQGFLGILMQERVRCEVDGLERDPAAAEIAAENYRRCACAGTVRAGDWRAAAAIPAERYDLCVCNPPYFPPDAGPHGRLAAARTAERDGAEAVCAAARRALRCGGRLCLCLPPEALTGWLCALRGAGLEPKRLRPVLPQQGRGPSLLLLEGRKGGRPGLRWLAPLALRTRRGAETAALKRIYRPDSE